jgi:hypothetical protein
MGEEKKINIGGGSVGGFRSRCVNVFEGEKRKTCSLWHSGPKDSQSTPNKQEKK